MDDSRPVAAIVWLNVVWIRPSAAVDFEQTVDGDLEPGLVAVGQQVLGNGWPVLSNRDCSASASVV